MMPTDRAADEKCPQLHEHGGQVLGEVLVLAEPRTRIKYRIIDLTISKDQSTGS